MLSLDIARFELPLTPVPPRILLKNYLLAFEEEITKAKDSESLTNAMKERFPSADFLLALDRGAKASVKS